MSESILVTINGPLKMLFWHFLFFNFFNFNINFFKNFMKKTATDFQSSFEVIDNTNFYDQGIFGTLMATLISIFHFNVAFH